MGKRFCRIVHAFDAVDFVLMGAAVIGGIGGVVIALLKDLPYWAYQATAFYFLIAVSFFLLRHCVFRAR